MSRLSRRVIFIQIRLVVLGIHHLESRLYYKLFRYAQSHPLYNIIQMSYPFVMHLIIHMFHASLIPCISLDQYLNPNLYTIPNMQNMRFFCCSVYICKSCLSGEFSTSLICLLMFFEKIKFLRIFPMEDHINTANRFIVHSTTSLIKNVTKNKGDPADIFRYFFSNYMLQL